MQRIAIAPGPFGRALRRNLPAGFVLVAIATGVAAALVGYAPPG